MSAIPSTLLHGSRHRHIDRLSVDHGLDVSPFGPALYLTADAAVAGHHRGEEGVIYALTVAGNSQLTIAMDSLWKDLSVDARLVIQKLFKAAGLPVPTGAHTARAILDSVSAAMDLRQRNAILSNEGIWMLYGHGGSVAQDGDFLDTGVQYALLSDAVIVSQRYLEEAALEAA